jgi:hypothetical protein
MTSGRRIRRMQWSIYMWESGRRSRREIFLLKNFNCLSKNARMHSIKCTEEGGNR